MCKTLFLYPGGNIKPTNIKHFKSRFSVIKILKSQNRRHSRMLLFEMLLLCDTVISTLRLRGGLGQGGGLGGGWVAEEVWKCVMVVKVESSCRRLDMWPSTQEEGWRSESEIPPPVHHGVLRSPRSVSVWNHQAGADPERPARLHEVGSERLHPAVYLVSEDNVPAPPPPPRTSSAPTFLCVHARERPHTRWLLPDELLIRNNYSSD